LRCWSIATPVATCSGTSRHRTAGSRQSRRERTTADPSGGSVTRPRSDERFQRFWAAGNYAIFDPEHADQRLVGRVVGEGFSDELSERRCVVLEGIDGRTHYTEIGVPASNEEPPGRNNILELKARPTEPRKIDRTIARICPAGRLASLLPRTLSAPPRPPPWSGGEGGRLRAYLRHEDR
jgi:hypothetical protein